MKTIALAALLALAPAATLAQAAEPPPAPAPAPVAAEPPGPWSLGAGVGFTLLGSSFGGVPSFGGLGVSPPSAPAVVASLERAVAPGWWLVLGAAVSANRERGDAPPASYTSTRADSTQGTASVGVRRALTRPGAPVTVSMHALANVGYSWSREDLELATPETRRSEAIGVGLTVGLAVERELSSGLSLRVATPLLSGGWNRATLDGTVIGHTSREGGGVSLVLAPSLELRLAF